MHSSWWNRTLIITPFITSAIFVLPVMIGLLGTWLPAFGYFPAIGLDEFSIHPWLELWQYPGFTSSLIKTFVSGVGASVLALGLTFFLLVGLYPSTAFRKIEQALSPILSIPHAAFAIGLGFLITPSGWLIRLFEALTGLFPQPPSIVSFQDPIGASLAIALAFKELPFLLFMSLAVLPSLKAHKTIWLMQSMGHSRRFTWSFILFPQLYKQIKLPFFAVLAYSMTVVDIAIIAGPTTPPTLAVLVTRLFDDPNLESRLLGAAGATLLLLLVIMALLVTHLLEKPFRHLRRIWLNRGNHHKTSVHIEKPLAQLLITMLGSTYLLSFAVTLLWSFSQRWRYPDILPSTFSLRSWSRVIQRIEEPFWCTFWLALLASFISLALVILALENECRLKRMKQKFNTNAIVWLLYIPLLTPQIAFLFGFQVALIHFGLDGHFYTLLWSHLIFVLPYVFLTLGGPYRRFDERYLWQAMTLNGNRFTSFWKIKFTMLLRPILYAFATGFSVSIAQYLPTLFIGTGKFTTLTTEAVAMATGSDRRMMAVMAIWQQSLPLIVFAIALIVPAVKFRHRRAMRQG